MLGVNNIGSALNIACWAVSGVLQKSLFHCDLTSDMNIKFLYLNIYVNSFQFIIVYKTSIQNEHSTKLFKQGTTQN